MRKKIITLVFIGAIIFTLVACKDSENKNVSENSIGNGKDTVISNGEEQNIGFHIIQTPEVESHFSIPNPKMTKEIAEVVIHKCEYKEGQNSFYCVKRENEPTYDLSF